MVMRLLFGFSAVLLALLMAAAIHGERRDAALYRQAMGIETTSGDNILMLSFLIIFVGLPCVLLLWMAGPYEVEFDLHRSQHRLTQGFPLMARTRRGATEGGAFYVVRSRSGQHLMKFRPSGYKWGYLLETYATDEQARTEVFRLADALGLTVERRNVN